MLRVGGLLFSQGSTVANVLDSATNLTGDRQMLKGVDSALDKIAKNAEGHFGHMFDTAQSGVVGKAQIRLDGKSLGVFGPDSGLRKACSAVTHAAPFELLVLLCILANLFGACSKYASIRSNKWHQFSFAKFLCYLPVSARSACALCKYSADTKRSHGGP